MKLLGFEFDKIDRGPVQQIKTGLSYYERDTIGFKMEILLVATPDVIKAHSVVNTIVLVEGGSDSQGNVIQLCF